MPTAELRELKPDELKARALELKHTIFEMRSKHNTGVLDSTADLGKTRKEIARCLTLAREVELGVKHEAHKAEVKAKAEKREAAAKAPKAEKAPKEKKPAAKKAPAKKSAAKKKE